jgi:hypothetical protein
MLPQAAGAACEAAQILAVDCRRVLMLRAASIETARATLPPRLERAQGALAGLESTTRLLEASR